MDFEALERKVVRCRRCPRLVEFREKHPCRAAFKEEKYWRKPLPGFGDRKGKLLILGLAPAAHGGNRTGRLFTGDESARFLMDALYSVGFAAQPTSLHRNDGLELIDCYMTAAVKCVPPGNKPLRQEFLNCSGYLENELALLKNVTAVLGLGKWAFESYLNFLKKRGVSPPFPPFAHGSVWRVKGWPTLYGSYHPSPQNTYTKKLTKKMFCAVLQNIQREIQ